MLTISVPSTELYDESTERFLESKETVLKLEHSLISVSKWEAKWKKPFLTNEQKSKDETMDYIACMTISLNIDHSAYLGITSEVLEKINEYIEDPMTATTFSKSSLTSRERSPIITSELIYYWMVAMTIPFECEKWHLNRLLTLINICDLKNKPAKKRSSRDVGREQARLNAERKAKYNTGG
jgi:hypothetical protein